MSASDPEVALPRFLGDATALIPCKHCEASPLSYIEFKWPERIASCHLLLTIDYPLLYALFE